MSARVALALLYVSLACVPASSEGAPPALPEGFTFDADVPYGAQSPAQKLDILYPSDAAASARPAIVHIHGGGWYAGSKGGEKTLEMLRAFAANGYVAVSIDYRLSDEARFPAAMEDCKLALRWLRANAGTYHIDPDHLGAIGGSAGGHLSAFLAVTGEVDDFHGDGSYREYSSAIQAAVPICPPTDLSKPLSEKFGLEADDAVIRFLGGTPLEKQDEARRASPATYVCPGLPPMFFIHGVEDKRVLPSHSTELAARLRDAGNACEVAIVEGFGHNVDMARTPEMLARIVAFFDRHLKVPADVAAAATNGGVSPSAE